MTLQLVKKMSGFDIYQKIYKKTHLTEYYSWSTNYLDKEIISHTFSNHEKFDIIDMNINFKGTSSKFEIKIANEQTFFSCDNCNELVQIANNLKSRTENLYDFLCTYAAFLNLNNETIDNKDKSNIDKKNENESENDYDSEYEYNPYEEFEEPKQIDKFVSILANLKSNARKYYDINPIIPGKLNINSDFIIHVISKELESIHKNCNYIEILPNHESLFNIDFKFLNFKNENLMTQLAENELDGIVMNLKLNKKLYPYYPPQVSFKTSIDNKLDIAIINLSYFDVNSWNPTNTLEKLLTGIHNILDKNCSITLDQKNFPEINSIIQNIMSLNSIQPKSIKNYDISIDHIKIKESNPNENESKHWASGVGYGHNGRSDWNINEFIETNKVKYLQNLDLFKTLHLNILKIDISKDFKSYIINSDFTEVLLTFINQINLVEFDNNFELYKYISKILYHVKFEKWDEVPIAELSSIASSLFKFHLEADTFIKLNNNLSSEKVEILNDLINYYKNIKEYNMKNENNNSDDKVKYCAEMKVLQFAECTFKNHHYVKETIDPSKLCIQKLSRELATYQNSLPLDYSSSVFVRYDENNMQLIKALIIGPEDTPYENGCFEFDIFIPNNYPNEPPKVNLQTTGNGKVRFNPNLYASGKVCLSLLGTWNGSQQEKWNKETSTLLQVLVSIQSLILVDDPYFNEPGYERDIATTSGKQRSFDYNDNIRKHTSDLAIMNMINDKHPNFKEVIDFHFNMKKNNIIKTLKKWHDETKKYKSDYNKILQFISSY